MTFDDDMLRLNLATGPLLVKLNQVGMTWPPPEELYLGVDDDGIRAARPDDDRAYVMRQVRRSQITDEQRAEMTNVFRGADYEYVGTPR